MSETKQYDKSYKEQAVKLAGQIGTNKASDELKVPYGTLILSFYCILFQPAADKELFIQDE